MKLATSAAAVVAATLLGCGSTADLVYIIDVTPVTGAGATSSQVDTTIGACLSGNGLLCEQEQVGEHFARITVANDFTPDPDNPSFGRRVINRFQLQLVGIAGGIQLPAYEAGTRVLLDPGRQTQLKLILADSATKVSVGTGPAELYEAKYTLFGPDGLELVGNTTVTIGNFNSCDDGMFPVEKCP